jgi:hypothetical protein
MLKCMKYSTHTLDEIELPLAFRIKVTITYCPGGVAEDWAPVFYSADPESAADQVVKDKGWDLRPGYDPRDVWVDGGI